MDLKKLLTGAAFLCSLALSAQTPKTVDVPTDSTNITNDVNGKEAVIEQLKRMFSESKKPQTLLTRKFVEQKPDFTVIPGTDGRATLIYKFRYMNPESTVDALEAVVSETGTVELVKKLGSADDEYSRIVINDKQEKMEELKNVILTLDKMQPQILVETMIIEVYLESGAERDVKLKYTYTDAKYGTESTFGFNLDAPSESRSADEGGVFDFIPYAFNQADGSTGRLNAAIRWLNTSSNARILSAPNIIADQGSTARFVTGEDLPISESNSNSSTTTISFKYKRVGVTLDIVPRQINEKTVQLDINPEVRSVLRYQTYTQSGTTGSIPVISVRSIDTRLTVSDGDIIALGGLYSSEQNESLRKMPYIGDIPVLGSFFNGRYMKTSDKQLIFLMKVHILQVPEIRGVDPENTAHEMHTAAKILRESDILYPNKPPADPVEIEEELARYSRALQKKRAMEKQAAARHANEQLEKDKEAK